MEQSELEAALAASRLASNSVASSSGRPPRPAVPEHAGPSDDEELRLALELSGAEAKKAAKGKGVLRQSTSEQELQLALHESAQLAPKHKQQLSRPVPQSSGGASTSSQLQQDTTDDEDLARALYESQQLAAASSARIPTPADAAPSTSAAACSSSLTSSPRQLPSAPVLASPAAAAHLQRDSFPVAHQSPQQHSNSQPTSSHQPPASSSTADHRQTQPGSQPQPLYPHIFQPGMSISQPTSTSPHQHESQSQHQHSSLQQSSQQDSSHQHPHQHPSSAQASSHNPLYRDGHHGSSHLESVLSADEAFARALQDAEYAGAVTERVQQAAPPSSQRTPTPSHNSAHSPANSKVPISNSPLRNGMQTSPTTPQQTANVPKLQGSAQQPTVRKHYADPNACAGCGQSLRQSIFGRESYVVAQGLNYHPGCFCCAACSQPIGANVQIGWGREDGLPYHFQCYRDKFDPRCSVCKDLIPSQVCASSSLLSHA